jgi:predicted negative regulator of RcsB-dependent stress response
MEALPQKPVLTQSKEYVSMQDAKKQLETGLQLFDEMNYDMAVVYLELAGEEFARRNDLENALLAYEKALYCLEEEEPTERISEIKKILDELKSAQEGR